MNDQELSERLGDVHVELGVVAARIGELVDVVSGEAVAVPARLLIDAIRNPVDAFRTSEWPNEFHSLKIDNPSDVTVGVAFGASGGASPGNVQADELVPGRSGRIITRPYSIVSIGVDPAVVPPAGQPIIVRCTFYARQLPPSVWTFATLTSPRPYVPRGGQTLVADNTNKLYVPESALTNYLLVRVDIAAAAGDGVWITENGEDATNAGSARLALGPGEEYEVGEANVGQLRYARLGPNNVNTTFIERSYGQ